MIKQMKSFFVVVILFLLLPSFFSLAQAATVVSKSAAKLVVSDKSNAHFVLAASTGWRSEHEATGETTYRNFPSIELGYAWSTHQLSMVYGSYSNATGNPSLATTRELSTALVLFSEKLVSDSTGDLEGVLGLGAYQEKITSRIYLISSEDVSEWQSQANVGMRYLFKLTSFLYSGPSLSLSFAKNYDPNPMLDFSWGLRAQF